MEKDLLVQALEKEVRKKCKKKTRKWSADIMQLDKNEVSFDEVFKLTEDLFQSLLNRFTEDEKEKWSLNKLRLGVKMSDKDAYEVQLTY